MGELGIGHRRCWSQGEEKLEDCAGRGKREGAAVGASEEAAPRPQSLGGAAVGPPGVETRARARNPHRKADAQNKILGKCGTRRRTEHRGDLGRDIMQDEDGPG